MSPKSSRRQRKAIPVRPPRPWGVIALVTAVGVLAVTIISYAGFASWRGARPWSDRLTTIAGVVDYVSQKPAWLDSGHRSGPLTYEVTPPVGGQHNGAWQNCVGDVYDAPIANEHAVHSLEHGAVWITHRPDLPADQVTALAARVTGTEYMLMSPVENLSSPITLQAWGYQLKVDSADDVQITEFINAARINAGLEQGAACSGGVTATGTTPRDLDGQQP
ncbi:DUF3105 domain-containing protein [Micromonospora sp. NBC_01699]|uniref:DUF3105 domain-containing protein n=1 Tax=Micromonospora sp. NBC_01699 TaxID=2975984 RepID=UPI002E2899AF|nr:DUF3105 domain-containing protein [Micromonospora sp. NBC_01699]